MIKSFADSVTDAIFNGHVVRRVHVDLQKITRRKLRMLDAATELGALRIPPNNKLEALKGDMKGLYSIRVNQQWRIIFRFEGRDAFDVRLIDYH